MCSVCLTEPLICARPVIIYMAQALADHTDQRRANLGAQRDAAIPCALQRIGALRLAMVRACSKGQTACRGFFVLPVGLPSIHMARTHFLPRPPRSSRRPDSLCPLHEG